MTPESAPARRRFLTAAWRHLLMLNFPVERAVLEPFVPRGTVLDTYKGIAYASVVGFRFLHTRVLGITVPFHRDFEEVNLRFYVRRFAEGDWRRGVVFLKEIVPKPAITAVARVVYNENYVTLPMRHHLEELPDGTPAALAYEWEHAGRWNSIRARVGGPPREAAMGTLEEFITEHYWGYTAQRDGGCLEYQVEHPRWRWWPATDAALEADAAALWGADLAPALSRLPTSAFVAEGSDVTVFRGLRI